MKINLKFYIILFIFLLSLFIQDRSSGDVGSCARYKVNLIFDKGDSLVCFIQLTSYDDNLKSLSNEEILKHIKEQYRSDTLTIYKRIQTINYPEGNNYYGFKYSAVANEDRVVVKVNSISRIRKSDVFRCEYGKFPEGDRYGIHFTSQVIEDLSQKEIDLLQTKPYSQINIPSPSQFDVDVCLNYNRNISEELLNKLCDLYLNNEKNLPYKEFEELQKKHYEETKRKLQNRNIIVIHLYGND